MLGIARCSHLDAALPRCAVERRADVLLRVGQCAQWNLQCGPGLELVNVGQQSRNDASVLSVAPFGNISLQDGLESVRIGNLYNSARISAFRRHSGLRSGSDIAQIVSLN